jgi:hypothetical protein
MLSSDESVGTEDLLSVADKLADMDPGSARLVRPCHLLFVPRL